MGILNKEGNSGAELDLLKLSGAMLYPKGGGEDITPMLSRNNEQAKY